MPPAVTPTPPITPMPPALAARVAAGEVVERPASVVKELLENSLDAGASRIDVEIASGGLSMIRVVDDGHGMPQTDLPLAFERFATSKLGESSDLLAIATLGFRGEALPSIASVADVTARTRFVGDDHGFECNVAFGSEPQVLPAGTPAGTSITVRQLFRNVPARRKFLGSPAAEAARIAALVSQIALVRADVRFRLVADGAVRVDTPGDLDDISALTAVYGATLRAQLVALDAPPADAAFSATGAIALPSVSYGRRSHITIAVNGRAIRSPRLSYAVERGYQGWLADRRYPLALIKLKVPYDEVDVNVHPAKSEVRFRREGLVFSVVERAVRDTLSQHAPVREFSTSRLATPDAESLAEAFARRRALQGIQTAAHIGHSGRPAENSDPAATDSATTNGASAPDDVADETGAPSDGVPDGARSETSADSADGPAAVDNDSPNGSAPSAPGARHGDVLPYLRVLGQAQRTYIVAEDAQGVFLLDQHAAHERVKFEELLAARAADAISAQPLLKPHHLALSAEQQLAYSEASEWLASAGWQVDPFGGASVIIRAVPATLEAQAREGADAAAAALTQILDEVRDDATRSGRASKLPFAERLLATVACHSAVRAGDALTLPECEQIVRLLEDCEHPQACPHGRPTMLLLTGNALEREFGRRA